MLKCDTVVINGGLIHCATWKNEPALLRLPVCSPLWQPEWNKIPMGELHLSFIIFCLSTSLDIMLQVYKPNRLDRARNGRWQRLVGKRYTCRYKLQVWRWKTWKMGLIGAKHTPHSEISYKKIFNCEYTRMAGLFLPEPIRIQSSLLNNNKPHPFPFSFRRRQGGCGWYPQGVNHIRI